MTKPRVFTISPSRPFLPTLAQALYDGRIIPGFDGSDPLRFCTATVFLPNRRSCRLMRQALLDAGKGAMLLPRLVPLGDVDDDEADFSGTEDDFNLAPAIPAFERHLLLARLILAFGQALQPAQLSLSSEDAPIVAATPLDALSLATPLMALMDQVATERVPWSNLDTVVDDHLDRYWQLTRQFLSIASDNWPLLLAQRGEQDAATHRDARLQAEARRIAQATGPFIAAGSTGSILATRDLLKTIAHHPQGAVVLPGFNTEMDDAEWADLAQTIAQMQGHPQYGLARLVRHMDAERKDVKPLAEALLPGREHLVRIAMRTTATTDRWHQEAKTIAPEALDGITLIEAAHEQEEALACAIFLRHVAQDPAKTAALVTPDRALAYRIMAELDRWSVAYDDSGGEPLAGTAAGIIARLSARLATQPLAAADLLSLLAHPALQKTCGPLAGGIAALDLLALRGLKQADTLAALPKSLTLRQWRKGDPRGRLTADNIAQANSLIAWVSDALAPLATFTAPASLPAHAKAHLLVIKALDPDAQTYGLNELVTSLEALSDCSEGEFLIAPEEYPAAFEALMASVTVRKAGAEGAQIRILGLPESRLLHADCVVLAGLVEGGWPMQMSLDPWLNRAMRQTFGIDPPERRIGLAAHDFVAALGSPQVVLSRSDKVGGVPSVPSRWLQRLAAVAGDSGWKRLQSRGAEWVQFARSLDACEHPQAALRPAPCPPTDVRPRRLSVTEVERLQRDPYAVYARHVLKLVPLDPYDVPIGAAERGTLIHDALRRFTDDVQKNGWPSDALATIEGHGRAAFADYWAFPDVQGFWWPRFKRIAAWFLGFETGRSAGITARFTEIRGETTWKTCAGRDFCLSGIADRIDVLQDGTIAIIDYKTGSPPSQTQVQKGVSPQLPLEAAIAGSGGFAPLGRIGTSQLIYVRLSGLDPAGRVLEVSPGSDQTLDSLVETSFSQLKALIDSYENPMQPYLSWVMPQYLKRLGGDYDHLARVAEWSMSEEGGE